MFDFAILGNYPFITLIYVASLYWCGKLFAEEIKLKNRHVLADIAIFIGVAAVFSLIFAGFLGAGEKQRIEQERKEEIRRYCYALRYEKLEKNLPPYAQLNEDVAFRFLMECISNAQ